MTIVESTDFLNLIPENGLSGKPRGSNCSEDAKSKTAETLRGRKHSEEALRKMSLSQKERFLRDGPNWDAINAAANIRRGSSLSDETKKKLSEVRKGKPKSQDHRDKLAALLTARNQLSLTDDQKASRLAKRLETLKRNRESKQSAN